MTTPTFDHGADDQAAACSHDKADAAHFPEGRCIACGNPREQHTARPTVAEMMLEHVLRPAAESYPGGPPRQNQWQRTVREVASARVRDLGAALTIVEGEVEAVLDMLYERVRGCARSELLDRHSAEHGQPASKKNSAEFTRMADRWVVRGEEAAYAYCTMMRPRLDHDTRWAMALALYAHMRGELGEVQA